MKPARRITGTMFLILLGAGTGPSAAAAINWYDWTAEAFRAARDSGRLIMVNVGHEGCTACRYMEERTFTDHNVISLLNTHFVSIQVDSEARPDIGERYSDWAWPATAFMRPDGTHVLALRGSRGPEKFVPVLEDLIVRHAAGTLDADSREPYVAPHAPASGTLAELRQQVHAQLDRGFDDEIGGWGSAKVLEYAEPTLQFLLRGHLYEDHRSRERGLKTVRGFAAQTDAVWGGLFYASFQRWGNTVKEKRTESQAAALQLFSAAFQLTDDPVFRDRLEHIDRYLRGHMRGDDGLFFASQKDTVPGMTGIDIDAYYTLDDRGRRAHGLPTTDHAAYTDLNARVIEGYVRAFEASGETHFLTTALTTAAALRAQRRTETGWFVQLQPDAALAQDQRVHVLHFDERPYLRTQAYVGRALLALYQASSDSQWLDTANGVATALRALLEDHDLGGFFAAPADGTEATIARRKPLEDNAVAAQFFYSLGVIEKNDSLKKLAEKTLRGAAAPAIVKREGRITGNLAIALELLDAGYVEFSVVGDPTDPNAQALLAAGRRVFEPRKVLHYEAPGRYPDRGRAAMYICNDDACSLPIFDPSVVAVEAAKFTPAVFAGGSTIETQSAGSGIPSY